MAEPHIEPRTADRLHLLQPLGHDPVVLHDFFDTVVARQPGRPAIECDGEVLTYAELDRRATAVAAGLTARGVGPGALVALYGEKSCGLFAALIGTLKAGAGYVPIDPKFPAARVEAILEDAGVTTVFTDGALGRGITAPNGTVVLPLEEVGRGPMPMLDSTPRAASPSDVCYVIYTSGSTGRPKGVVIEHRNAVNFVRALKSVYKLSPHDRIYQGFSLAFDASVEEIWGAFAVGGTLVVPKSDIARSAQDAAEFITSQGITYFSTVPPFLAMFRGDLPTVKTLVLGGDVCPPELVQRWATPARRLLNTYGPTEATVVATSVECKPGHTVTIGKALPGYTTYVLDDKLKPVERGESGELYIGGQSVARGYLNRPEMTAERFIENPFGRRAPEVSRLYQTRDLVRELDNGELVFLGRADAQIKIRGFRIELSEIEAVLMDEPSIQAAAVNAVEFGALKELAAYVVPEAGVKEIDRDGIAERLRARLPEYMVPRYLDLIDDLPQMTSGKIDRKALPPPRTVLGRTEREIVAPTTETERMIVRDWEKMFELAPVSIDDDFFTDLRGHSLFAAQAVTELRQRLPGVTVSVPDIYEFRTARQLAQFLDAQRKPAEAGAGAAPAVVPAPEAPPQRPPLPRFRYVCMALQAASLLLLYAIIATPPAVALVMILMVRDGALDIYQATFLATIGGFAIWPSWLLLSIAVKWLVIGRYKAGWYPVWSFYYFRWWLVSRFQQLSLSGIFIGTPLMNLYFRAMGARVGAHCSLDTNLCSAFDLVSIGKDTSIGPETHILGYRVENGWLILAPVTIGEECFVGTHCCLGLNARMFNRSKLDDMSHLVDDAAIAPDRAMRGAPAMEADVDLGELQASAEPERPRRLRGFLYGLIHLLLVYVMGYFLIFAAVPAIAAIAYALLEWGPWWGAGVAFVAIPLSFIWYLTMVVVVKWVAIGRIKPGIYRQYSARYLRYWFLNYLLTNTRYIVMPLYSTLFLPPFLRLLGAKIGRGAEISTVMQIMPDLLDVGDGCFLADACMIGGHRSYLGGVEIRRTHVGKRSFVGNSALLPVGSEIGDNVLIGVNSIPPQGVHTTPDDTRWLGSPSFELPNTQEVTGFSERDTYDPSKGIVALRLLVETLRLILPGVLFAADLVGVAVAAVYLYYALPLWGFALAIPFLVALSSLATLVVVALLKIVLMGRFVPVKKPLWSPYVWMNDVVNALYEGAAAGAMSPLMGTPFIAPCLRLIGCKIGRWVFIETTLFSEFDLVEIGDEAALNLGATVQTHLFEDRVMKSDRLKIGNGCSLGNMAVVLYSTEMKPGASLDALSVLMKGEVLPQGSAWTGIPTKRAVSSRVRLGPPVAAPALVPPPAPPPVPPEQIVHARVEHLGSGHGEAR